MRTGVWVVAIFIVLLLCSATREKPAVITYEDETVKVQYETRNGLYDGKYTSWYKNGKKKAEGQFKDNMRTGKWIVWDSTGRKRMERLYKNNYEYKLIFPAPPTEGPIPLLNQPCYKLEYNAQGFINYFYLVERAVHSSKMIWRYMPKDLSNPVFANDNFYHAFVDSVIAGKLKAYEGPASDEFKKEISAEARQKLMDTASMEVIGYKLKEDWFFDKDRLLAEIRPIGLSPVFRSKKVPSDTFEICWFIFSRMRPLLAAQKVSGAACPEYIHTFDDVFFFRYFRSDVYKYSRYYNRALTEAPAGTYNTMFIHTKTGIDNSLIEAEHDAWIYFSK